MCVYVYNDYQIIIEVAQLRQHEQRLNDLRTQLGGWNSYYYKLAAPQEKVFIWPPFFQYNKRLILRQKTGWSCLYMPQDGHWLASFEVIPLPPKSWFFRGQKNENSPLKTVFPIHFIFWKFWRFLSFRRKFYHAVLDSRDDQGLPLN